MKKRIVTILTAVMGRIAPALLLFGLILGHPGTVAAQTWNGSVSDLWSNVSNWTPNTVPNSSAASVIINNATNNPVLIDVAPTIANLTLGVSNSVTLNNGESLTIAGGAGAGSLDIAGTLTIGSTGSFTDLILAGTSGSTITLSGGGTLTLSNSPNNRVYSTTGDTLVNDAGNTIQGAGQLGINNAGFGFTLNNAGIINANQVNALQVAPSGTVTNTGTLEATNGGTLLLIATVTNTGGLIQATGVNSLVEISGSTINGGTLTTLGGGTVQNSGTATLNGVTISNGSTFTAVNGSSTTLQGTINLAPTATLAQNSTGSFTDLHISGTVELAGGGTLALSNSPNNRVFATGSDTLINDASNTIQGAGALGINNGGFAFTLNNAGTINANVSGGTLQVAPSNTVTNTGTLEATNGGTLALIGAFNNTGGLIHATGASSVVELNGSTINGGTLTTSSGGTVQNSGTATLNGVTISNGSTFTAVNSSSTFLQGIITINPTATLVLSSTGSFTDLHISGTVELAGGGTLAMSNSPNNRIFASGADTLINDAGNTISGSGQLGINNAGFAFTLTNNGTINANQSGSTLQVAPTNTVTNTNLMEATNGGTLLLTGGTFNNTGGLILATDSGSVVDFNGATISGGTLTTQSSGTIQNSGTATLDGTTNSPTISNGSTVTLLNGTSTTLLGTIINNGTIAQNSTGSFTDLHISGAVTLSGTGVLALSDSPNNRVFATGADSLTNDVNHTISGAGQLGINNAGFGFTLTNNGTILANQSNALNIAPSGNTTNNGTFQANSGSTLFMNGTLTNYDPGTSTLTGGTYNAFSGTIQLSQANTGTGAVIATNAATILLDGASAKIADGSGNNILQGFFTTNAAAGHFTIQNGANLTTPGDFSNAGTVTVGNASTFKMGAGGANSYTQSGGTTQGIGTIAGNVTINGGTIQPGLPNTPGTLAVNGNYNQTGGVFNELINSSGNGLLTISGVSTLGAGANLNIDLLNGFTPTNGETFTILGFGSGNGTFANAPTSGFQMDGFNWTIAYNPTDIILNAVGPVLGGGPITAIWQTPTGDGNWTTASQWDTSPGPPHVVPNNANANLYAVVLNDSGHTLTLDNTSTPTGITVNTLSLQAGTLAIGKGATLNLAAQPNGITDISSGAGLILAGTFTTGGSTSALAQLASVEGALTLANGATTGVTPGGGTLTNSGTINVQQSSTLAVTGALTNSGAINTGNGASDTGNNALTVSGLLTNNGTITLKGTGDSLSADLTNAGPINLNGNNQTLTDTGDFNNNSGGSLSLNADTGKVTVAGAFKNASGASVNMNGANGVISVTGAFSNTGGTVTVGGTNNKLSVASFTNSGTTTIASGGLVTMTGNYTQSAGKTTVNGMLTSPGGVDIKAGVLGGNGTVNGNVLLEGGSVDPGLSPGTLHINGNYTQAHAGLLDIELGGHNAGVNYDQLAITGNASLDGTVDVSLFGNFAPKVGDEFDILPYGGKLTGQFAAIDSLNSGYSYSADYSEPGVVELTVTGIPSGSSVPEPTPIMLLTSGVIGWTLLRRMRLHERRNKR